MLPTTTRLTQTDPTTLTDLERAARFLYLQRVSFGGKVNGRTFGTGPDNGARFDLSRLVPILEDVHERLAGVTIECLPWDEVLKRYDRPYTLFYLDPPYYGVEDYYGKGMFDREDFARLADALASINGRFILSINDHPSIRKTFRRFEIEEAELKYTVNRGAQKRAKELIITNRSR